MEYDPFVVLWSLAERAREAGDREAAAKLYKRLLDTFGSALVESQAADEQVEAYITQLAGSHN